MDCEPESRFGAAMDIALTEAAKYVGATAPNPPVGAVVLDEAGAMLAVAAHERAGTAHAERRALALCAERGTLGSAHTVVVTLEPCHHYGRTPPCTEALLASGIRRVVYGAADPNPVAGGGAAALAAAGLGIVSGVRGEACAELIAPFRKWVRSGLPFVTVKSAHAADGSMIPPPGQKTFTSAESLRFAHELRKRADAVLTGSGTVLADDPAFTVRHVADHPAKSRYLFVCDRRRRVPRGWAARAEQRGFHVVASDSVEEALRFAGERGCLEVLVEAGPLLTAAVLGSGFWDRHFRITAGVNGAADRVELRIPGDIRPDPR